MSLAFRAVIAIALMIGFYALALGISGTLLWLVWMDLSDGGVHLRLLIFGGAIAGMILWSIVPRREKYVPPGPRLEREEHPELFALIDEVARAAGQEAPAEVYLDGNVNAGVLQRGGFLGIGSRRVMELGLPLMQALTLSQFRAVLAHELGHYHGGDTKLLPLIYRTRSAMGRTISMLADDDGVLHKPFEWYGKLYMRVTQAISRAQELAADRLSAEIAGAKNAASALVAVERAGAAHQSYWDSEVMPLIAGGYRPPLAAGFEQFMRVEQIRTALAGIVETSLREGTHDPYDSHPPLRERVASLGELPSGEVDADEPRAVTLLRDLPRLEEGIVNAMLQEWFAATVKPVTWEEAGTRVYLPAWRERATQHASALRDVTPLVLPKIATTLPDFSARLKLTPDDGEQTEAAKAIVGSALAVRLHELGWMCDATPGRPIAFTRDGKTIEPFLVVQKLRAGELAPEAWEEQCRAAGIAEARLVE